MVKKKTDHIGTLRNPDARMWLVTRLCSGRNADLRSDRSSPTQRPQGEGAMGNDKIAWLHCRAV